MTTPQPATNSTSAAPCPFCGSTNLNMEDARDFVSCRGCGTEGPFCSGQGSESSLAAWNRRAPDAQLATLTRERDAVPGSKYVPLFKLYEAYAELAALKCCPTPAACKVHEECLARFTSTQAPRVPAEWMLVPVKCTPEMIHAAHNCKPPESRKWHAAIKEKWAAMLSAAPAPVDAVVDTPAEKAGPQPLTEADIGTLESAVENMRSVSSDEGVVDARWRLASKIAAMVKRLHGIGAVAVVATKGTK